MFSSGCDPIDVPGFATIVGDGYWSQGSEC
jgi:hypothetical protein